MTNNRRGFLMKWKRYQYYTRTGKEWSKWFRYSGDCAEKWQLKGKLLNEYKETEETIPEGT